MLILGTGFWSWYMMINMEYAVTCYCHYGDHLILLLADFQLCMAQHYDEFHLGSRDRRGVPGRIVRKLMIAIATTTFQPC